VAGGESEIIDNWLVINSIDNGYLLVDNGRGRNSQYINVRHALATFESSESVPDVDI